ncbi:urea ABC transporter ATP-binding protein UrtD [Sediminicoccus rosea]|jgi:urea transport system ATP-binding protein|uniref:Urea ABC transporter ATP-binding protein UrtD n=1 Tax=Sediminicoccus rosea TaxID=1225128 RepID=A0ABZ0PCT4_9PROT|nr:urea ABC transporter ATP-binding protein UrtD [Sediminicoccus rosea]WPB83336.1 urea ABC transporter ATP-binding protein UrtD [Sediminicoccus rosea]
MNAVALPEGDSTTGLYLDGVSVVFDGFRALNNLSLIVEPGELRAVIGPNGAGKTTMMDVITGKTRPGSGIVRFGGRDLTRMDEAAIANLGIGRKFQKPTVFDALTVFENLELALKAPRGPIACLRWVLRGEARTRIERTMAEIGLTERAADLAGLLSHGQRQWLEIGMLLMQDPRLLLVDEPVAGMTDHETEQTAALLVGIAGTRSVVVVEHDLEFVKALGSRVTVLHEGSVLSEGSITHVQNDPRVIEVYLGR